MIGLNPFLDSLCNFGFKNEGLHPGGDIEFPGPQDVHSGCLLSTIKNIQITTLGISNVIFGNLLKNVEILNM